MDDLTNRSNLDSSTSSGSRASSDHSHEPPATVLIGDVSREPFVNEDSVIDAWVRNKDLDATAKKKKKTVVHESDVTTTVNHAVDNTSGK